MSFSNYSRVFLAHSAPQESKHDDSSWHFERRSAPDVNQQDPKYTEVDCSSVRELGGQSDI